MCRWQTLKKKATKTSLKKWLSVLWISITIIPTCLLCQINANSSVAEFLTVISKVRKRKKIWSWLLCVHFKTKNCSRAVTVKKCTEKCAARAKCFFAFSAYSFFDVFVVAGNFGWQLREGTRKSSGASCSKGGECCPLEKSPSSLWCNYFPQLLTLHLDQCCLTGNFFPFENVGTWRTRWTSRTSRTTWWTGTVNQYIICDTFFFPQQHDLTLKEGEIQGAFWAVQNPVSLLLRESLGEVTRWGSYHFYIFAAWDQFAFGDRFNLRTQNGTVIPSMTGVIFYPGFCYSWHGSKVWEALCPRTSQGRQK